MAQNIELAGSFQSLDLRRLQPWFRPQQLSALSSWYKNITKVVVVILLFSHFYNVWILLYSFWNVYILFHKCALLPKKSPRVHFLCQTWTTLPMVVEVGKGTGRNVWRGWFISPPQPQCVCVRGGLRSKRYSLPTKHTQRVLDFLYLVNLKFLFNEISGTKFCK